MKYRLMKDHGGKLNAYVLWLMGVGVFLRTRAYIVFMGTEAGGQPQV